MEQINQTNIINKIRNALGNILRKKWAIGIILGSCLVFSILLLFFSIAPSPTSQTQQKPSPKPSLNISTTQPPQPTPQSVELQKAIQEAQSSDKEYDDWQDTVRNDYPWIKKLPVASPKYFVYFDLTRKMFIGRLYPTAGDDVQTMKTMLMDELKNKRGIPIENFKFEWTIKQQ